MKNSKCQKPLRLVRGGFLLGQPTQQAWGEGGMFGYSPDYWIVKIDANGLKEWDKRFGGLDEDNLTSLQQTMDGGYILGGYSFSGIGGDKTEASRGGYDYWVLKIDANGTKQWDKRFGGTDGDGLAFLHQTIDGGYILGGYSNSGISGDKTEPSWGLMDYWIVKIDANGTKQWDKRFGGTRYDQLTSLQQTRDGGYILGGYSHSDIGGDKTESNRGTPYYYDDDDLWIYSNDYWIVKIDANGMKEWDKRFGGNDWDELYSLQQTTDGGYILGGNSNSEIGGDKTQLPWGDKYLDYGVGKYIYPDDYWIVKTDGNGVKQWDARFGGTYGDALHSLQQTSDGGYILGGYSESGIGGDKTEDSRGGSDYWIVKLGAEVLPVTLSSFTATKKENTALLSWQTASEQNNNYFSVQRSTNQNNFNEIGRVKSKGNSAQTQQYTFEDGAPFSGNNYYRLQQVDNDGNFTYSKVVLVNFNNISNIKVFPNPSQGFTTIEYNSNAEGAVQIRILDATGKQVFTKTEQAIKGSNTYQLNLSHLINGMYNLQLTNSSGQSQVKFIIEK